MRRCSVCDAPDRARIDELLARDAKPLRILAAETGLGHMSLFRHRQEHLPALLTAAQEAARASDADSLLARVEKNIVECQRIARAAEQENDWSPAVAALREVNRAIELLAKLRGELNAAKVQVVGQQINVNAVSISGGNPDIEIAVLVAQVTNNFSPDEINRLRELVEHSVIVASGTSGVSPNGLLEAAGTP